MKKVLLALLLGFAHTTRTLQLTNGKELLTYYLLKQGYYD
jgi:hypothetical protein